MRTALRTTSTDTTGLHRLRRLLITILTALAAVTTTFGVVPAQPAAATTPVTKPPTGVMVRSVDGAAVVTFRKVTGRPQPYRYEVALNDSIVGVQPGAVPAVRFENLPLGSTLTATVTALYSGLPSQAASTTFTPLPAPSAPPVKITRGLGTINFQVDTKFHRQPAPVYGYLFESNLGSVLTRNGRGQLTGVSGDSSGTSCSKYSITVLYDLGDRRDAAKYYTPSQRFMIDEWLCPYVFKSPRNPRFDTFQILNGQLQLTAVAQGNEYVDLVTVTYNGRTYRHRGVSEAGYPFTIPLRAGYRCNDPLVVTLGNRLGTYTMNTKLGLVTDIDEDPVTCIAPGEERVA